MADKSARIIASSATDHNHQTVNIVSTPTLPDNLKSGKVKRINQLTAAQTAANKGSIKTLQDSGGTVKGLHTVHIPGYTTPN